MSPSHASRRSSPAVRLIAAALLLAPAFAGCVSPGGSMDAQDAAGTLPVFVDPIVEEHDHASFADHALSTDSMSLVAHTTMTGSDEAFSYLGEMDTHGDLAVVQVLGRGSMPGFVVLDVSDPAHPTPIGRAEMPFSYVVDVKFSPDGESVFAASQSGATRSRTHDAITDDPVTAGLTGNGFTQFDISDPTNPTAIAGGLAEPTGCHMLSVKELGGELTVFCVHESILVFRYTEGGAWMQVAAIGPGDAALHPDALVGETQSDGHNGFLRGATPHDITIQEDPKQPGRWLALVSYWDFGLVVYDVTDPLAATFVGAWVGGGAEHYEGNVHGAQVTLFDDKRVIVAGPELLGNTVPAIWVLDADDMTSMDLLAEWVPPGEHPTHGLLLTVHQLQVVDGRIYLTFNHAGLWVLDLATIVAGEYVADPARPEVLGYYLPHEEVKLFDPEIAAVPNTWDVNLKDGYIFATDRYTGFYVLHYEGDTLGDAALTSMG